MRAVKKLLLALTVVSTYLMVVFALSPLSLSFDNRSQDSLQGDEIAITPFLKPQWVSYDSHSNNLSFTYPINAKVDDNGKTIYLTQWGADQKPNQKFSDGIALKITQKMSLTGNFEDDAKAVRQAIVNSAIDMPLDISSIYKTDINGKSVYQFTVKGLEERRFTIMPVSFDQYVEIIDGSADSGSNAYKRAADTIVASITKNEQ
ncbi:MAG TPA: hypothetical protein VF828_04345 [Patescibacteria group bacterium]